jgi:general secretion pathway protein C
LLDHNARMSKTSTFSHSVLQGDSRFVLTHDDRRWPVVAAGVLWLVAGLSAGYWVLQVLGRSDLVPVGASPAVLPAADSAAVSRALGFPDPESAIAADGMAAPVSLRYTLLGVVADRQQGGAALIAIDGEPPRPYPVGAQLEGGLVLQSVDRKVARLGPSRDGPSTVELQVPEESDLPPVSRPPVQSYTPPPSTPVYTPPPQQPSPQGASPDLVPSMPMLRGGDGTTVLPADGGPPGS